MYFQSNSAPRAPTHNSKNLVKITSAPAQPMPAVKTFAWPLPGIPFRTRYIPTKSAKSIDVFRNSYIIMRNFVLFYFYSKSMRFSRFGGNIATA